MAAKQRQEALRCAPGPQSAQTSQTPRAVADTRDATAEHNRTELELELEQHWRATFEANPTMYFIVDKNSAIVSVNPFGAQQLGYAVSELVGQPLLDVVHAGDRAFVQQQAAACFANLGSPLRWEARKLRKDGSMLWVPESRPSSSALGFFAMSPDRETWEAIMPSRRRLAEAPAVCYLRRPVSPHDGRSESQ